MTRSGSARLARLVERVRWSSRLFWRSAVRQRGGRRFQLGWPDYDDVTDELRTAGVAVGAHEVDVEAFWRFVDDGGYRSSDYYHGGAMANAVEKWLEHWVSVELTRPQAGEVLIDVASCWSPFPDVARKLLGVEAYRQDVMYEPGVHGDRIGSDAASIPLPDASADVLTLHCSFEHLELDRDSAFIREAGRILRPGGRLCILPLYTCRTYSIQSDPATWATRDVTFEPDARICLSRGWGELYGRLYDARHLLERVAANAGLLRLEILRVANHTEVDPATYLRFAALLVKTEDAA